MYIVRRILKVSAGWCSKSIDEPWWSWWTQALKLVAQHAQRYFLSQAPPSDSKDQQKSAAWGYDIQTGSGQYGARLTGRCCLRASGPGWWQLVRWSSHRPRFVRGEESLAAIIGTVASRTAANRRGHAALACPGTKFRGLSIGNLFPGPCIQTLIWDTLAFD